MLIYCRTYKIALPRITRAFADIEFMAVRSRQGLALTSHSHFSVADKIIYDLEDDEMSVALPVTDLKDTLLITHRRNRHAIKDRTDNLGVTGLAWTIIPIAYRHKQDYAYQNARGEIRFKIGRLKERVYKSNINT